VGTRPMCSDILLYFDVVFLVY